MKLLQRIILDVTYLIRCLKATWLTWIGNTVVYVVMLEGNRYGYQYVSDFRKFCGVIILGLMESYNTGKHFVTGIVELKNAPTCTIVHSVHSLKKR